MFKNVKKLFLFVVFVLVSVFVFACDEAELSKEACKDYCDKCTELNAETCKDYVKCKECEKCTEINAETCKDFINECPPAASAETCKEFINKDSCKEFITECPECPELNKENCKSYCDACPDPTADTCKEFFPFVAPTAFVLLGDVKPVGQSFEIIVEDFEPIADNVFTGLIWSSSDESIATVDANGVVTGVKPGDVVITAKSMLDETVYGEAEVTIDDPLADDYDIVMREQAAIVAALPAYAAASFDFPKPWNSSVEMTITDESGAEVNGFVYPEGLAKESKLAYTLSLKRGSTEQKITVQIWAVLSLEDNSVNRLAKAIDCAETLIKDSINGALVTADLVLPTAIYGATLTWDSKLPTVIDDEGKYYRQNDNTPVSFDLTIKCGDNNASKKYSVTAKGYEQAEKLEYILTEGSLAAFNGKDVSTSLALPEFDGKFKALLSYTSSDTTILDNDGTLVAYPAEKTEVKFTVDVDYSFVKTYGFKAQTEFVVNVLPETAVAKAANAFLVDNGYDAEFDFPYGVVAGNVLDVPTTFKYNEVDYTVAWDVSGAIVSPKSGTYGAVEEDGDTLPAFELTSEGQPKLVVQFLRYTLVQITGTFSDAEGNTATVVLTINIGASESGDYVYSGTWTSGDQKDGSLNPRTGAYDSTVNASHFDKTVGYISRPTYGWGYWSGYKITAPEYEGLNYQSFIMDYMFWEVVDDGDGVAKNTKTLFNNGGDMGGNWGWLMHNSSSHDIMIEVGTYAATGQNFGDKAEDGSDIAVLSAGSRVSWAMDGYAVGFVCDKDGNVLNGSGTGKLQNDVPSTNLVKIGSDDAKYYVGDSVSGTVYYLTVPAGGYAMSWKYQFYAQIVASLYPFCQKGAKLEVTHYDRHPLNSQFGTYCLDYLKAAEENIALGGISNNQAIETNLNKTRLYFDTELDAITKAEIFPAERLEAAEKAYAAMLDAEIAALLAKEGVELPEGEAAFVTQVGAMKTRLDALSAEITAYLTKKADFDTKYNELAAIDLTVTLDYQGGYAMGYYKKSDFNKVIFEMMLKDLYDHLVEQGAFQKQILDGALVDYPEGVTPEFATFATGDYFNANYAKYAQTILGEYLFTAAYDAEGNKVENYRDVIEGSTKFFNTPKGNKWIAIMNWVDEGTRAGNMGGQDAYGRKGEISSPSEFFDSATVNLVSYAGADVTITNSGTLLGAYRFAQWINGGLGNPYKLAIPENTYAAIFDRQQTQAEYAKVVYHCTDGKVELPIAAYKEGAEFAGWFFEDGTEASITGALFANVTVYAKWNPILESKVEAALGGKDVTPQYYGISTNGYRANTALGSLADQVNHVGLGKYAVVVGDLMFVMPKYALIELGKDGTTTFDTKESVQVHGTDGSTQFSTGLLYNATTDSVTALNSYGHGALYQNVGEADITISDIANTYGRNLGGAAYGYNRYLFEYNAETKTYTAKLVGATAGTSVTIKPGDFFWCPMTADRFCSGLTDCDGTSGVKGCLSDGCEVSVLDVSQFLPKDIAWNTALFLDGDKVVSAQYLEVGTDVTVPADQSKDGFKFLGWNTDKDATVALETIPTDNTGDVTYYAIYQKLDKVDAVTVEAGYTGDDPVTFATFEAAMNKCNDNAVVTVKAGTYDEVINVTKPLTFKGPNAGVAGYKARGDEAVLTGTISIASGLTGVAFDGFKFEGHNSQEEAYSGSARKVRIASADVTNFSFVNNLVVDSPSVFLSMWKNTNTNISDNFFNFTAETTTGGSYWRPIRLDSTTTDLTFNRNKYVETAVSNGDSGFYDALYIGIAAGTLNCNFNDFYIYNFNWTTNFGSIADGTTLNFVGNKVAGDDTTDAAGLLNVTLPNDGVLNMIGNEYQYTSGTSYSVKTKNAATDFTGMITIKNNFFDMDEYKPRVADVAAEKFVHTGNYVKANAVTTVDGYKAITLDGNFGDLAAYKASLGTASSATIANYATGYVNGTLVYLSTAYKFNAYYDAKKAVKFNVEKGYFEVIGDQQDTPTLEYGKDYDFLIAVHGTCTDKAGHDAVDALPVGTIVVFEGMSVVALNALAKGAVSITASFYAPVE